MSELKIDEEINRVSICSAVNEEKLKLPLYDMASGDSEALYDNPESILAEGSTPNGSPYSTNANGLNHSVSPVGGLI